MMEAELIAAAREIRSRAHAPYSGYAVGAALLGVDGRVYAGVNVENASYGLTVCAERNAIAAMVAAGVTGWTVLAVSTADGGSPCGACRQVLREFAHDPAGVRVLLASDSGVVTHTLEELLPFGFSLDAKRGNAEPFRTS